MIDFSEDLRCGVSNIDSDVLSYSRRIASKTAQRIIDKVHVYYNRLGPRIPIESVTSNKFDSRIARYVFRVVCVRQVVKRVSISGDAVDIKISLHDYFYIRRVLLSRKNVKVLFSGFFCGIGIKDDLRRMMSSLYKIITLIFAKFLFGCCRGGVVDGRNLVVVPAPLSFCDGLDHFDMGVEDVNNGDVSMLVYAHNVMGVRAWANYLNGFCDCVACSVENRASVVDLFVSILETISMPIRVGIHMANVPYFRTLIILKTVMEMFSWQIFISVLADRVLRRCLRSDVSSVVLWYENKVIDGFIINAASSYDVQVCSFFGFALNLNNIGYLPGRAGGDHLFPDKLYVSDRVSYSLAKKFICDEYESKIFFRSNRRVLFNDFIKNEGDVRTICVALSMYYEESLELVDYVISEMSNYRVYVLPHPYSGDWVVDKIHSCGNIKVVDSKQLCISGASLFIAPHSSTIIAELFFSGLRSVMYKSCSTVREEHLNCVSMFLNVEGYVDSIDFETDFDLYMSSSTEFYGDRMNIWRCLYE